MVPIWEFYAFDLQTTTKLGTLPPELRMVRQAFSGMKAFTVCCSVDGSLVFSWIFGRFEWTVENGKRLKVINHWSIIVIPLYPDMPSVLS